MRLHLSGEVYRLNTTSGLGVVCADYVERVLGDTPKIIKLTLHKEKQHKSDLRVRPFGNGVESRARLPDTYYLDDAGKYIVVFSSLLSRIRDFGGWVYVHIER